MREHCFQHPQDEEEEDRHGKLLLRLPALRLLNPAIMEELFFAGLIGNVQIDSIIPYILRMETAEYSSQVGGNPLQSDGASPQLLTGTPVHLQSLGISQIATPVSSLHPGTTIRTVSSPKYIHTIQSPLTVVQQVHQSPSSHSPINEADSQPIQVVPSAIGGEVITVTTHQ